MNTKLTRAEVEALTNEAHSIHMATLEKYGNKPQDQQRATLRALVRMFAEMFAETSGLP